MWVGIFQRDERARGQYKDFKWYRPSEPDYWANRYLPDPTDPPACGHFRVDRADKRFYDGDYMRLN